MRWWVRPDVRIKHAARVSRSVNSAPEQSKSYRLCQAADPISGQSASGVGALVNKKRKLLLGLPQLCLAVACVATWHPHSGSGILTRFPFGKWVGMNQPPFQRISPTTLGSTNPRPIAVHVEPFLASVFKVLIWIFATATKICTKGHFTLTCVTSCSITFAPSYSTVVTKHLCCWWRISGTLSSRSDHPASPN